MINDKNTLLTFIQKFYNEQEFLSVANPASYGVVYDEPSVRAERFARQLWGLCWENNLSQEMIDETARYIAVHCDPENTAYWGEITDYSQIAVEILPISLFMLRNREKTWAIYTEKEKNQIANWFLRINQIRIPENNWLFFRILVNLVFFQFGKVASPLYTCREDFEKIEKMYLGNGWYSDGFTKQRDYYIAFAMHYYSLIYSVYAKDIDPDRCGEYQIRADLFSKDYAYWFSPDGSSVPFGRSLIYRFASNAFWGALVWSGSNRSISDSVIKGIIFRNFRWWEAKELFQDDRLTLGYTYPNTFLTEEYNSIYSPYWCLKANIIADIPDEHPFWLCREELLRLEPKRVLREAGMVVARCGNSVMLFPFDQKSQQQILNGVSKYEKFVYSNISGFCVSRDDQKLIACGADSTLSVSLDQEHFVTRRIGTAMEFYDRYMLTCWEPYGKGLGVRIVSYIVPGNPYHVRVHQIQTRRILFVYDSGFSIEGFRDVEQDGALGIAKSDMGSSLIRAYSSECEISINRAAPNSNILYPRSSFPTVKYVLYPGSYTLIDTFGLLTNKQTVNLTEIEIQGRRTVCIRSGKETVLLPVKKKVNLKLEGKMLILRKIINRMVNGF